jgi:hypothetical protein
MVKITAEARRYAQVEVQIAVFAMGEIELLGRCEGLGKVIVKA